MDEQQQQLPLQGKMLHDLTALMQTGRYTEAESLARQAVEQWPGQSFGWKWGVPLIAAAVTEELLYVDKAS